MTGPELPAAEQPPRCLRNAARGGGTGLAGGLPDRAAGDRA